MRRLTKDEFILKSNLIHGNKYDYSFVNYVNNSTKVVIICPEHGKFEQTPSHHLSGKGCPRCAGKNKSTEDVVKDFRKVHSDRYDYSLVKYSGSRNPVDIICLKHGKFSQTPHEHLSGCGCPECGKESVRSKKSDSINDFINKAINIHNNRYDYSNVNYTRSSDKVEIICPEHGPFMQTPNKHLMGENCPQCSKRYDKSECELYEYIKSLLPGYEIIRNSKNIIDGLELDIYIPGLGIAFEYDGLFWHSEAMKDDRYYHVSKTDKCLSKGIQLIHIFEDEWLCKNDICKSRIQNILNKTSNRIYARKCHIVIIDSKTEREFLNENHIQGYVSSKICYGLYYNNELVSIMSFSSLRKNLGNKYCEGKYELLRFCNKLNMSVTGGASKLLNHFIKEFNPIEIISYADRRWSNGKLYKSIGFSEDHKSSPNYFYIIKNKRINRYNLRKDILIKKYNCPVDMTEHEFCLGQKWYRIYDCGTILYRMVF